MAIQNQSQSIVDYLKKRGFQSAQGDKFPLFQQRGQIFDALGLSSSLGEFRGSANQNLALLNKLGQAETAGGVGINPSNIFSVIRTQQPAQEVLASVQATPEATPDTTLNETPEATPIIESTEDTGIVGQDASQITEQFELSPENIAQQALEQVTGSATFPLKQEALQAEKEALGLQAQQQKEELLSDLASRGLFFSGKKTKGLESIDAEKVANLLGVDRKFALLITQGLETAAQSIAKEAQAGRKEAIDSLEALGVAINPVTNRIEPTLAAKKARAEEERAERSAERANITTTLSIQAAERADIRLQLAEEAARRAESNVHL